MSFLSQSVKFIRKAVAFMLLPMLASSCQLMTEDYDCVTDEGSSSQYINITISVSVDDNIVTRSPQGGENGDGKEKGKDRENEVNGITLIFYQDPSGINTASDDAAVLCVKYYSVRPFTSSDYPNTHTYQTSEANEVLYTTGDQKLGETLLQAGQSYKVLVVANASVSINVGDKIKTVRDKLINSIYTGDGAGINASNFVMVSESDASVSLENPTLDTTTGDNRYIYYFNCIHIERLAARIDYCTSGATYSDTYGGYVYNIGSTDAFHVVTKVTPFNLYNEDEYLFKRVQDAWPATATTYLGDESVSNYVTDPNTANKDNSNTFNYLSPIAASMNNGYTQSMSSLSTGQTFTANGYNNVIIAYPRENTLMPTSHLKKYATGLAFEVNYYANSSATPVTNVYYHYLRHQGEKATGSYEAKKWADLSDTETSSTTVPMNYGVVRNNIYRVSIESFSTQEGRIKIKIEEEKWRHVDNPAIYI